MNKKVRLLSKILLLPFSFSTINQFTCLSMQPNFVEKTIYFNSISEKSTFLCNMSPKSFNLLIDKIITNCFINHDKYNTFGFAKDKFRFMLNELKCIMLLNDFKNVLNTQDVTYANFYDFGYSMVSESLFALNRFMNNYMSCKSTYCRCGKKFTEFKFENIYWVPEKSKSKKYNLFFRLFGKWIRDEESCFYKGCVSIGNILCETFQQALKVIDSSSKFKLKIDYPDDSKMVIQCVI